MCEVTSATAWTIGGDFNNKVGCGDDKVGCLAECENYGNCKSASDLDTDQDDYDDLGVCVWCSDDNLGAYTCDTQSAQLSFRGIESSKFNPFKKFSSEGNVVTSSGVDSVTFNLKSKSVGEPSKLSLTSSPANPAWL